jgi:hypothetical protein
MYIFFRHPIVMLPITQAASWALWFDYHESWVKKPSNPTVQTPSPVPTFTESLAHLRRLLDHTQGCDWFLAFHITLNNVIIACTRPRSQYERPSASSYIQEVQIWQHSRRALSKNKYIWQFLCQSVTIEIILTSSQCTILCKFIENIGCLPAAPLANAKSTRTWKRYSWKISLG